MGSSRRVPNLHSRWLRSGLPQCRHLNSEFPLQIYRITLTWPATKVDYLLFIVLDSDKRLKNNRSKMLGDNLTPGVLFLRAQSHILQTSAKQSRRGGSQRPAEYLWYVYIYDECLDVTVDLNESHLYSEYHLDATSRFRTMDKPGVPGMTKTPMKILPLQEVLRVERQQTMVAAMTVEVNHLWGSNMHKSSFTSHIMDWLIQKALYYNLYCQSPSGSCHPGCISMIIFPHSAIKTNLGQAMSTSSYKDSIVWYT